jgi:1,4-alpha-glucan branching enzyme
MPIANGRDRAYQSLGAHLDRQDGVPGTRFAVWAPNARAVSVIGDFNGWSPEVHPMAVGGRPGVWRRFIPHVGAGSLYKYAILPQGDDRRIAKADPCAFAAEAPPGTASRVWDLGGYDWGDADWMARRAGANSLGAPIAIYEVHLGSWMRAPEQGDRWLTYREVAARLADYVHAMGFTHVELMPLAEFPFDGSWGYQVTGYYAATARFGTPQDLMALVDILHRRGIGVILDWVPAHFPRDAHGLGEFDGTHLYEYADPRKGISPKWDTYIFDYTRPEVVDFLVGSALFWLDVYHVDGLRVDAVESLLHLDFGHEDGAWDPNVRAGRDNLEAIAFLQSFNRRVHDEYPGVLTIAEDPTTRPGATRPAVADGLGFDLKWDLGWVHDTLDHYMTLDPIRRKDAHGKLTFRMHYAFDENYLLPLSHDEVVHGRGSLLGKMPGDAWQAFASLRLLLGEMYALPGKKLLFMGTEFGQRREWDHDASLDWHLLDDPLHQGLRRWVHDLNALYRRAPALHRLDCRPEGFAWVDCGDAEWGVICLLRKGEADEDVVLVVCNFTPVPRHGYRVGVPVGGRWEEVLNGDASAYGGSGLGNLDGADAAPIPWHGHSRSLELTLPPLAMIVLRPRR